MQQRFNKVQFLLVFTLFISLFFSRLFSLENSDKIFLDDYIHSLSSLIFYIDEHAKNIGVSKNKREIIAFSDEDVASLWNKVMHESSNKAYQYYLSAEDCIQKNLNKQAKKNLKICLSFLNKILEKALENENCNFEAFSDIKMPRLIDSNVKKNPYLSNEVVQAISPYLLPMTHLMRKNLDSIFLKKRATADDQSFYQAGFRIIAEGPRSFIIVAKNKKLSGFLVKAYLDTQLNKKYQKESWEWLALRCKGAKKIREIIKKRKIHFFVVPDKWIYSLPPTPSPPLDEYHTRHLAILLVTDMQLTNKKKNYHAWTHYITKQHLDELFEIIVRAKGSSYRPDNIAYTENNKFAFIDTEYPSRGPDFKSIRYFLNPEMCDYWDSLIRNGGPKKM